MAPLIGRAQVNDTISNNISGLNGKNVVDALSGRCAGVQVINPTGIEGISSRILIRGNQNITTNNQPLFVIDGVRIGFEICEDSWVANRPGRSLCRRLTDVILNPSASHFAIGRSCIR